ncbi:hypothetical protein [Dactylosporangium sp. CA-139066]|uniref:hypothetical protein n=1 Tax=Dactylosporangium sp. CA-139066 TaxID=3239930 RepID=UPI003D8BDB35
MKSVMVRRWCSAKVRPVREDLRLEHPVPWGGPQQPADLGAAATDCGEALPGLWVDVAAVVLETASLFLAWGCWSVVCRSRFGSRLRPITGAEQLFSAGERLGAGYGVAAGMVISAP